MKTPVKQAKSNNIPNKDVNITKSDPKQQILSKKTE